jgi:hypothetical protein
LEWHRRFLHDELWLRSRRLLIARLRDLGLDSDFEEYQSFFEGQQRAGSRLLAGLGKLIGAERAAEIGAETFLGARNRRFLHRLPFILGFMAEYVEWLTLLSPVEPSKRTFVTELSALFNLGIVLVDHIGDEPQGRAELETLLGDTPLERLHGDPSAPGDMARDVTSLPSAELRVLSAIVTTFFDGLRQLNVNTSDGRLVEKLLEAISAAQSAQLAVAGGSRRPDLLRAKSVTPFIVPPALVTLVSMADPHDDLFALGERIGEVFWRVDDLLDVGRDHFAAEGNLLLSRAGVVSNCSLAAILENGHIEGVAREIEEHAHAVIRSLDNRAAVREKACRWLEMYIIDWMR